MICRTVTVCAIRPDVGTCRITFSTANPFETKQRNGSTARVLHFRKHHKNYHTLFNRYSARSCRLNVNNTSSIQKKKKKIVYNLYHRCIGGINNVIPMAIVIASSCIIIFVLYQHARLTYSVAHKEFS